MHRIDGSTVSATLPTPGAVVGTPGFFTDGDPAASIPATVVSFDWANAVQEELVHVITDPTGGNLALDKASNTQLLTAIGAIIDRKIASEIALSDAIATLRVGTLIIKRGGANVGSNSFLTAFPTFCDRVYVMPQADFGGGRYWVSAKSITGFTLSTAGGASSVSYDFLAFGY